MDSIASFAGCSTRKIVAAGYLTGRIVTDHRREIYRSATFVNETGLDGLYEGRIDWSLEDINVIMDSLKSMGFTITQGKRTVEAVVIESPTSGKSDSELSAMLPNGKEQ